MEDNFVLELGSGLLHLIFKTTGELFDGIAELRKQNPYIPRIRIIDNINLEPLEISLNAKRYSLDKNDNFVEQILTIIDQYVDEHPEIQKVRKVFKTGESLSFIFPQENKKDFKVNLMLSSYPSFWNSVFDYRDERNTNCAFSYYVTEVSEASNGLYKVEIINTKSSPNDKRYYLGGRFKFYLKQGDVLDFQYFDGEEYKVKSTVVDISYNTIELEFDKKIEIPKPFLETENLWI